MIVRVNGGMGNQMFQAAFGASESARRNNEVLRLHLFNLGPGYHRAYSLDCFGLRNLNGIRQGFQLISKVSNDWPIYQENSFAFDENVAKQKPETYFIGNFQTEKYFNQELVRSMFQFKQALSADSIRFRYMILSSTSCSIHVRRTDYLNVQEYHGMPSMAYYNEAIKYVKDRTSKVNFFVFSDDPVWCRNNFIGDEFHIVDINGYGNGNDGPSTEWEDMSLMSLCDHAIIPNSTFGWWGAWLGETYERDIAAVKFNRMTIAPKAWFNPNGPAKDFDTTDIVPERWIRL
jgi:hypothetical protein